MTTKFTDGAVTVTLDDGLDRFVRNLMSAAERETVALLEREAAAVATEARANWYGPGGVEKETGLSGDIQVTTIIDRSKSEVRVRVGSTDTRKAGKQGKPLVVYVHAPGAMSLKKQQVTREVYFKTTPSLRANYHPLPAKPSIGRAADVGTGPYIWISTPNAGDGQFLLAKFVRKPVKGRVKFIAAELARAIVARGGG